MNRIPDRIVIRTAAGLLSVLAFISLFVFPKFASADDELQDEDELQTEDAQPDEIVGDPSQNYRIYRTTKCSGASKCGSGSGSRRHHSRNRKYSGRDAITSTTLGAEGTPNIPGAAGTPNIPGAAGTPVVPGASSVRR